MGLNYFAFETQIRKRLREMVDPMVARQIADRETMAQIQTVFEKLNDRLAAIEGVFEAG